MNITKQLWNLTMALKFLKNCIFFSNTHMIYTWRISKPLFYLNYLYKLRLNENKDIDNIKNFLVLQHAFALNAVPLTDKEKDIVEIMRRAMLSLNVGYRRLPNRAAQLAAMKRTCKVLENTFWTCQDLGNLPFIYKADWRERIVIFSAAYLAGLAASSVTGVVLALPPVPKSWLKKPNVVYDDLETYINLKHKE